PDVEAYEQALQFDISKFKKLLKKCREYKITFIFQDEKSLLDNDFKEVGKLLKANPVTGLVGARLYDQGYIRVKSEFNEPEIKEDETHYFNGHDVRKMKMVQEE
ncbi:MAG: hypothetical protein LBM02_06480, partial [Lachnospiraceae bacterium]|nr:hypothetical protein [Lachnospiraceae bacterium]